MGLGILYGAVGLVYILVSVFVVHCAECAGLWAAEIRSLAG